ncbi:MAG: BON domain-containing protein [Betaproteobacteria bacterium]|nr:BON domain-containing protein [Betaproteobacteria bacterium]
MTRAWAIAFAAALSLAACGTEPEKKTDTAETSQDAALTAKVKSALATDVGARAASNITVEASHGVVRLSGFVDSQDMADRAVVAAKKVAGIQTLKNDLRVKTS